MTPAAILAGSYREADGTVWAWVGFEDEGHKRRHRVVLRPSQEETMNATEPTITACSPDDVYQEAWNIVRAALDSSAPADYPASDQVALARWVLEHPPASVLSLRTT